MTEETREWLAKANDGDGESMLSLGMHYLMQNNHIEAVSWFEKASEEKV